MAKALSCMALLKKKYDLLQFEGEWYQAFGTPEAHGVWFVWGNSGNGKTTFVLSLVKYLARFGKVAYNSLEESSAHTMQEAFLRVGMMDVARQIVLLERESLAELSDRLRKRRSPQIVVIDSFQYAELDYRAYKRLKEANPGKLIIFVSHADGKKPAGRTANSVMYDASLKIWVEGYRAFSKGRYIGPVGSLTVWDEGAEKYWGK
jgi:KaiC/GvpD/RAD55 family RecA-like ATPase